MDSQALITAVIVDVVLTGIIVFYFQKRTESNLSKKLFEHQVKFQEVHRKRVKSLEDMYHSYQEWALKMSALQDYALDFMSQDLSLHKENFERKQAEVTNGLGDLWYQLEKCRIYLPQNVTNDIAEIISRSVTLVEYTGILFLKFGRSPSVPQNLVEEIILNLESKPKDQEMLAHPATFVQIIYIILDHQKRRLEGLYKVMVEIEKV